MAELVHTNVSDNNAEAKRSRPDEQVDEKQPEKLARTEQGGDVGQARKFNEKRDRSYRKLRFAVLFGYLGANYSGLQRNPNVKTVEGELESAIVRAGAISADNAGSFNKVGWQSCARTDKGVSAVGNIVALKMMDIPELQEKIQKELPSDIRVFLVQRVPGGFKPRDKCSGRTYYYLLPCSAFRPSKYYKGEKSASPWVFDETIRGKVNEALAHFVGVHSYHNYTSGSGPTNPSNPAAMRNILSFVCSKSFETDDGPYVQLTVHGQSFVYNQIRKMVAMMVAMIRDGADPTVISACFAKRKKVLPLAPALGLFLFRTFFDVYNTSVQPPSKPLVFDAQIEAMEAFKREHIVPYIIKTEREERVVQSWLEEMDEYAIDYDDLLIVDPTVPPKKRVHPEKNDGENKNMSKEDADEGKGPDGED